MMDRIVLRLMCDDRGEISFLFGPWGAIDRDEAIREIECGERTYLLQKQDGSRMPFSVVSVGDSKRLTTFANGAEIYRHERAILIGA